MNNSNVVLWVLFQKGLNCIILLSDLLEGHEKKGLLNVFQKESHIFMFKFTSQEAMNKDLT